MKQKNLVRLPLTSGEEFQRAIVNSSPIPIFSIDLDGIVQTWNPAAEAVLGWTPIEVIGKLLPIVPEDRLAEFTELRWRVLTLGQFTRVEAVRKKKNGAAFIASISAAPIRTTAGDICGIMAFVEDVTEQREGAAKPRQQATLLDKASDAILVRDLEHRILYWNHGAERLYGWKAEEVQNRLAKDLLYNNTSAFETAFNETLRKGEWSGEIEQQTKSRGTVIVQARWTLVRDGQNNSESILAINTDITERKLNEARSLRSQRIESLGALAGGIAHDLNNILAPITIAGELLSQDLPANTRGELLDTLRISAKRGAELVKQILYFTRGNNGNRTPLDPTRLLHDICQILRETFPKNISIVTKCEENLRAVYGDPTQLHQVILNLCINARDAMPGGGRLDLRVANVEIDQTFASMRSEAHAGGYVLFEVADTGVGIPTSDFQKIFEPFFTTKEVGSGTGLGLSTSQAIVKSHEGFIDLQSEVGRGTRFRIFLPSHSDATMTEEPEPTTPFLGGGELVLLVDDEEAILKVCQRMLSKANYRVLTASNGAEAISIYAKHQHEISVVITDMTLPIVDGAALTVALRALNPNAKIIASSGLPLNADAMRAIGDGVAEFVAKPYTAEVMLKALKTAIHAK